MILSLWSVPDKEIAELISPFYSSYFAERPTATALRMAQKNCDQNTNRTSGLHSC